MILIMRKLESQSQFMGYFLANANRVYVTTDLRIINIPRFYTFFYSADSKENSENIFKNYITAQIFPSDLQINMSIWRFFGDICRFFLTSRNRFKIIYNFFFKIYKFVKKIFLTRKNALLLLAYLLCSLILTYTSA